MSTDLRQLLDQALELSEEERATLAGWLIESLEGEAPEGVEVAWRREIELRVSELEAAKVDTGPWNVAKDRLAQCGG